MTLPFNLPVAGLIAAYGASNGMGKFIVILQIFISIAVWSIMIGKYMELKKIDSVARYFRKIFTSSPTLLDFYFKKKRSGNPLVVIYHLSCDKLISTLSSGVSPSTASMANIEGRKLSKGRLDLVKGVTEETLSDQLQVVDNHMWILAIGSSITPLIGLLGTVWGILDAFQTMGATGSVQLSQVAPGLSSALLTTVVGLFVAIPSACGYNYLLERTRRIGTLMDGFTDEFLARMTDEFSADD